MPEIKDKKLEIQQLLNTLDPERLSKEDFVNAFEKVVKLVLQNQEKLADAVTRLEETYHNLTERNRNDYVSGLTDLKGQVDDLFVGNQLKRMDSETKTNFGNLRNFINEQIERKIKEIDGSLSRLDEDGKLNKKNVEDLGKSTLTLIEQKIQELDQHKSEVNLEIIEDLKKQIEAIKKLPRGRLGMRKVPITRRVDLSDQVTGQQRRFNLPRDTVAVLGIQSSQFPFTAADVDFTLEGNTLIFTDQMPTLVSGQTLVALLEVLFYP